MGWQVITTVAVVGVRHAGFQSMLQCRWLLAGGKASAQGMLVSKQAQLNQATASTVLLQPRRTRDVSKQAQLNQLS
jgi:hypothetical protein